MTHPLYDASLYNDEFDLLNFYDFFAPIFMKDTLAFFPVMSLSGFGI